MPQTADHLAHGGAVALFVMPTVPQTTKLGQTDHALLLVANLDPGSATCTANIDTTT
jgi:hypothetical protein